LLLGSSEHAEDVTHDCFLGLIRNPGRYDPRRASLRTYLYAAVRNLALHRLRKAGTERTAENAAGPLPSGDSDQPLASLLGREKADKIRAALALLPSQQREVIILFE
jgi:RNA polymerase sigma-70 factor (ECF subfamily)